MGSSRGMTVYWETLLQDQWAGSLQINREVFVVPFGYQHGTLSSLICF